MFIQVRAFESKNSLILNLIEVKTAFGSTSNPFLFMKYPIYVWNGKFCILWTFLFMQEKFHTSKSFLKQHPLK